MQHLHPRHAKRIVIFAVAVMVFVAGLDQQEITGIFGEPTGTERFVQDRVTLVFRIGAAEPYELSCTVHEEQGADLPHDASHAAAGSARGQPHRRAVDVCCTSLLYKIEKGRSPERETAFELGGAEGI
ncbi:hypothetical protein RMN56_08060 [Micromonospora halotolerans]|uniref:Uncharacterized protein n=1 Tax=Micromonospora halotolerans TaxID=709879 RepID=A0ABZ0A186_9ACTN|nr:hypothetical protein [Micromonospora halotolerans]WNM41284.1 hypothetical protein RMN56_08060 [Micromonospora halotolerans]